MGRSNRGRGRGEHPEEEEEEVYDEEMEVNIEICLCSAWLPAMVPFGSFLLCLPGSSAKGKSPWGRKTTMIIPKN